jgi:predicted nucleic acid-binding protein
VTQVLLVADTCSIMNFAAINRMPLLKTAIRGRGRWTQAVHGEVLKYSLTRGFVALKPALEETWFGEAIDLDSNADYEAIDRIRAQLGGVRSEPLKHLGEAESIRAIESRAELAGAIFLTDDIDAARVAENHQITVKDTTWLMTDAWSMGDSTCPEPYDVLVQMFEAGRPIRLPASHKDVCP